ncbi:TetR/AcrR family transcriptional regulator [Paenibacillus xylanilyticus]|uniref:TetR/AcrR family transcriptional regulator n=1 Tax=Paenibacillus xylanilyticus TaxID=248903 RepID=A0A7Y6EZ02_9BACL|nr:TetR/AcrR family transcriptional regulator [Paenibacillus xylanilyticus]NUU79105.1 TetR/AcrR family transcriptional regulator [Paenibacillus xylanilyticus]
MARSKEFEDNEVLEKAMKLFWEQGYEKTSISDLVEHMGIHRRSLYDTFGDKHTLFLKALDRFHDKLCDGLVGEVKRSKTATEALQLIFSSVICSVNDSPSGCLMVNSAVELAMRDTEVDKKTTDLFSLSEQLFKDIIQWGQQSGEFSAEYSAEDQAEHLHAIYVGIRVMRRTSIRKEKLQHMADVSIKLLSK